MTEPQMQTPILVVDDERFFREFIAETLEPLGYACEHCEDGESALDVVDASHHAAVVLDIRLPGMNGIEVLERLREDHPQLRVIMLSASTDQELVLDALRLGACDYLAKPLHDEELILAVQRACASHEIVSRWDRLRDRIDALASWSNDVCERAAQASPDEREVLLHREAVEATAEILGAGRTSLMCLDESEESLRVVSSVGHALDPHQMDEVPIGRGVAGGVIESLEPLVVADVNDDERIVVDPDPDRYASDSFVVAPVVIAGRRFGVLCATDRADGAAFGVEDLSLLRLLALRIASLLDIEAVAPAESAREPEDRAASELPAETMPFELAREVADAVSVVGDAGDRDAELVRLVCEVITNQIDPERLLDGVLQCLQRELRAEAVGLYLGSPDGEALDLEAGGGAGLRSERAGLAVGRGLTGVVLQSGHLVATIDPSADPRFDPEVDTPADGKPGPFLCVPLRLRGKVVGLCRIFLPQGASASARTGELLVSALSAAIRNVFLYRSLIESIEEVATVRRESRR